ncbi:ferredoxin-NADP reductase [Bradyrhizobium elkanii]
MARRDADFTLHYAVTSREQAIYLDVLAPLLNKRLIVHAGNEGRRLNLDDLFASLPRATP